ncbi:hypothetical protein AJ79_00701 [Helicocarpus griseus UAMH5409]|uniref:Altered inheritance of mitochondria protein 21 n=1 Tax=Helicocarpus griseus UAMH5409 TaxID=1447875 RepID=A0A2B7Y1W9_9EURO|nr:hypothetical protein AJ79_00701 [Helicocarpus griseus UAMH5409]
MSSKSAPTIPPRPSRSPNTLSPNSEMPKVPPRPSSRRIDRTASPSCDSYAPSPLNEMPPGHASKRAHSRDASSSNNTPPRPPSVRLPSVGQEGIEYADLEYTSAGSKEENQEQPTETRNVNRDLHLHAPKPSLPTSSAKAQVQAVTRTDSQQAAAAGFGKPVSSPGHDDTDHSRSRYARTNGSHRESSTASSDRRQSFHLHDESGIPEIGQRVPMYPGAGDVQAPSPAPHADAGHEGHHSGLSSTGHHRPGRHHQRTRSGRESSLPPGSYGLHGHGVQPNDKFERAWYEKHPDELAREEQGQYGPGLGHQRPEWAMSSDDLNKIVRTSANKGLGLATHNVMGTPEEEVGYIATEELASRLSSPPAWSRLARDESIQSQGTGVSPLKQSVVVDQPDTEHDVAKVDTHGKEGVIHIDEPLHHQHHPDGFAPAPEDHKQHGAHSAEDHGWAEEGPDEAPVLASDEIDPHAEHLQPAVSPTFDRRGSGYFSHEQESPGHKNHSQPPSRPTSRPSSRPVSTHGTALSMHRFSSRGDEHDEMRIALEDVEEYEPLFPEDDDKTKEITSTDRFKHPPEQHRFPSKDIWEDTPDSLQLEATVSTPDIQSQPIDGEVRASPKPSEQEASQKEHVKSPSQSKELRSHLDDEKPARPEPKQRFPSKDIWEDAPDSQQLVTTVQIPDENGKPTSPESPTKPASPAIPARPSKSIDQSPVEAKAPSPTETKKPPTIPSRPKPQPPPRPARPVKPQTRTSEESLTKTTSASSTETTAPPAVKPKPPVPSRPGGSKIAALKAGFLTDLEGRLKLGPQGPKPQEKKKPEPEKQVEKAPLSDARKGRARGPARRKPAAPAVEPAAESAKQAVVPEIKIVAPWDVFQIRKDGVLVVSNSAPAKSVSTDSSSTAAPEAKPEPSEPSEQLTAPRPSDTSDLADTTPKPAVDEAEERRPVARDSESSSPSRNPQQSPSTSSHEELEKEKEKEKEKEPLVEAEIGAGDGKPFLAEPAPAQSAPAKDDASIPDEKVEQVVAPDVEKKISDASEPATES